MGFTQSKNITYKLTKRNISLYDWIPDLKDIRDISYKHPPLKKIKSSLFINIPSKSLSNSVSSSLTDIYMYEYNKLLENDNKIIFDSNFLYNIQHSIYDSQEKQHLFSIRDALKITKIIGSITNNQKNSNNFNSIEYRYIKPKIENIQYALCLDHPIIFGMSIYESQKNFNDDILPEPKGRLIGGTCCIIKGYDCLEKKCFLIKGFNKKDIWIPFDRLIKEGSCFWIISKTRLTEITEEYSFREV